MPCAATPWKLPSPLRSSRASSRPNTQPRRESTPRKPTGDRRSSGHTARPSQKGRSQFSPTRCRQKRGPPPVLHQLIAGRLWLLSRTTGLSDFPMETSISCGEDIFFPAGAPANCCHSVQRTKFVNPKEYTSKDSSNISGPLHVEGKNIRRRSDPVGGTNSTQCKIMQLPRSIPRRR